MIIYFFHGDFLHLLLGLDLNNLLKIKNLKKKLYKEL